MKQIQTINYFNAQGIDPRDERLYSNEEEPHFKPTGFVDFNRARHTWATDSYTDMIAAFWTMGEVNTSNEKKNFKQLTENEQGIYKYTFGQLSFNDSLQGFYLIDIMKQANNAVTRSVMIKQAETEVLHSSAYGTLLDACGNSQEVFDLYKEDEMLARKNRRIAELFARHINKTTSVGMLFSSMASVCLEGVFFLTGFAFIYIIGDKVPGARDTIAFIQRDENLHLEMFANIVKTLMHENNLKSAAVVDEIQNMLREAVDIELEYGLYLIKRFPVMGLTAPELTATVQNYANDRCRALNIPLIYKAKQLTYLQVIVNKGADLNSVKSNFFESNVKNYAKDSLDLDDF